VLRIDKEPARLGSIARDVSRQSPALDAEPRGCGRNGLFFFEDPLVSADARAFIRLCRSLTTRLKYSPDGAASPCRRAASARDLVVSIADQAWECPPQKLDKIFARFTESTAKCRA